MDHRCAQLEPLCALRFRPSLSWAVHDALFSFWRLPLLERRAIAVAVPLFSIQHNATSGSYASLDWDGFLAIVPPVDDAAHPTQHIPIAWTLAHHAEVAFDALFALTKSETVEQFSTDTTLVHGATVRKLMACLQLEDGDYYMGFLILITVLEKTLYDLYYDHYRETGAAGTKTKNMILRDLLHSSVLQTALPPGMIVLLKILFLPSGLNLRNLVWHGFVVPAQFPRCFASLTAVVLLELPRFFRRAHAPPSDSGLFQLHVFDDRFRIPTELQHALDELQKSQNLLTLIPLDCGSSRFIPRGRERLVERALHSLVNEGDELWCLYALLPVLEHAIRIQFVRCNASLHGLALDDFEVAQIDQYYSTLDGFGQRDKHQVLLHSVIDGREDATNLNALYHTMPRAALAVGLDLFMMAAGPNVRAKLCHGEADLSTLLCVDREHPKRLSVISQLVLLTWVSLCQVYDHNEDQSQDAIAKRQRPPERHAVVTLFEDLVSSSFHPFVQLQRLAAVCESRLASFRLLSRRWTHARLTDVETTSFANADQLSQLEFLSYREPDEAAEVMLSIIDKRSRIREFACFIDRTLMTTPVTKPKTFVEYLVTLEGKVRTTSQQLQHHTNLTHCKTEREPADKFDARVERCLLALGDADGLSVSACMMEILASINRSLASFEARVSTLAVLIQEGSARTSQRRAFLSNVFLLPVFEQIQRLAFNLVAHQVHHLETIARRQAALLAGTSAPAVCPDARSFELLQRKILHFITAFEGCTGSTEGAQKSSEKALQLALQFVESKAMRAVTA